MENNLIERMKKYAEQHGRWDLGTVYADLQAAMRALEVAREALQENVEWHTNNYGSSEVACINIEALKTIDEILGKS